MFEIKAVRLYPMTKQLSLYGQIQGVEEIVLSDSTEETLALNMPRNKNIDVRRRRNVLPCLLQIEI